MPCVEIRVIYELFCFCSLRMSPAYLHRRPSQVIFHKGHHVAPLCFYSRPEGTTLVLERAFYLFFTLKWQLEFGGASWKTKKKKEEELLVAGAATILCCEENLNFFTNGGSYLLFSTRKSN